MSVLPLQRDLISAPFFDATARGALLLQRCTACRHWSAPEKIACTRCRATTLAWEQASGMGAVVSWAVVHPKPGHGTPTVVGIIELDEGPWMRGQLRLRADAAHIGMRVATGFAAADGGETIPVFDPQPESGYRESTN
ncbi:Zn-ribbon domain-containing OB-fold protein [Rhodococcus opacus]|uniref:Zn-ribbon domain-containing OB-fold protein n=1 Tax=Rhodococcus opacus TaxID=37919 RepID=UPI00294975D4|nr:OB-fold domain-containing protein [Rhodococcus opacus]MDV6245364.1 OB-fold domain-containing protein [Rhodococcus opacus]